jgi:hypothetical protein
MSIRLSLLGAVVAATLPALATAQDSDARTHYAISIGHHPRVDGIRLNFRDRDFDLVRGANVTIWQPYRNADLGRVEGLALGLPLTGVGELRGLGVGLAGVAVEDDSRGIVIGGIGVGAGGELRGINIGGIGAAAGGGVSGLTVGGIGVGSGGTVRGIAIGGIGAGAGGDVRGLAAGGIGVGAGGNVRGLIVGGVGAAAGGNIRGAAVGGIGVGAGGSARGILVGGIGVGAGGEVHGAAVGGIGVGSGGDVRGLAIGGIGVGAGGQLRGIAIGGLGVGAGNRIHGAAIGGLGVGSERIDGLAIGSLVRARETRAIVIAPVLFRSFRDAEVRGATVSAVNVVYGSQRGLALGVVNYTESLNGVQVGVLNIVRDNPRGRRVLPVVNWGNER